MPKKFKVIIPAILLMLFLTVFWGGVFDNNNPANFQSSKGGVYSPDGSKIAFFSDHGGGDQIWIMDVDGKDVRNVTNGHKGDRWPQFSADGKTLIFMSNDGGGWEIYTINIDSSSRKRISMNTDTELGASFSPDGETIIIGSINAETGARELYAVDRDGKYRVAIIDNGLWPYWSLDGETILYGHVPTAQNEFDIWAYDTKSKAAHSLTSHAGNNYGAKMNAEGDKVIFVSDRDGEFNIFEMNADGSDQHSLNIPTVMDGSPAYAPDGRSILFTNTVGSSGASSLYRYDVEMMSIHQVAPQQ